MLNIGNFNKPKKPFKPPLRAQVFAFRKRQGLLKRAPTSQHRHLLGAPN